jgi:hypothetical protein
LIITKPISDRADHKNRPKTVANGPGYPTGPAGLRWLR